MPSIVEEHENDTGLDGSLQQLQSEGEEPPPPGSEAASSAVFAAPGDRASRSMPLATAGRSLSQLEASRHHWCCGVTVVVLDDYCAFTASSVGGT